MENVERVSFGRNRTGGAGGGGAASAFCVFKESKSDRRGAVMTTRFGRNILTEKNKKGFFRGSFQVSTTRS